MAMRMNAELEAIRDNLECGHCHARFKGSDSQAWKVKYEKRVVYCSDVCRRAALSLKARAQAVREGKTPRRGVLSGPCKTCGKMYESRTDKMFCSVNCYTQSPQFKEMVANNLKKAGSSESIARRAENAKRGQEVPCLECGTHFYQKRPTKGKPARKFCNTTCYRSYLAKRFDRWIANPDGLAIPQCYDEFLDREELDCIVDGCEWHGQWLTLHLNQAHGIRADEFKRAAGFNLSTGVIAKPLAQSLRQRANVGVALGQDNTSLDLARAVLANMKNAGVVRYRSLEAREHSKKARLIWGAGPERTCIECGAVFRQKTPAGRALYCSVKCRNARYAKDGRVKKKQCACAKSAHGG